MANTQIREHLVRALEAELIGPYELDNPEAVEVLSLAPSRWYLTGLLAPKEAREQDDDPTSEEDHAVGSDVGGEDDSDAAGSEAMPKRKQRLPASIGLSVLLPAGDASDTIKVMVSWADYALVEPENDAQALRPSGSRRRAVWKRVPMPPKIVELALDPAKIAEGHKLEGAVGVWLRGDLRPAEADGLAPGTRALSLFVVNERPPGERGRLDEQFMFQVAMGVEFAGGIVPRPDLRSASLTHRDELLNDLQFRQRYEWAVGHGVSVKVPPGQSPVTRVETTWIPRAEVLRVKTRDETETLLGMARRMSGPATRPSRGRDGQLRVALEHAWLCERESTHTSASPGRGGAPTDSSTRPGAPNARATPPKPPLMSPNRARVRKSFEAGDERLADLLGHELSFPRLTPAGQAGEAWARSAPSSRNARHSRLGAITRPSVCAHTLPDA